MRLALLVDGVPLAAEPSHKQIMAQVRAGHAEASKGRAVGLTQNVSARRVGDNVRRGDEVFAAKFADLMALRTTLARRLARLVLEHARRAIAAHPITIIVLALLSRWAHVRCVAKHGATVY